MSAPLDEFFPCSFCGDDRRTAVRIYSGLTANICLQCVIDIVKCETGEPTQESSALMYQAGKMPREVA